MLGVEQVQSLGLQLLEHRQRRRRGADRRLRRPRERRRVGGGGELAFAAAGAAGGAAGSAGAGIARSFSACSCILSASIAARSARAWPLRLIALFL